MDPEQISSQPPSMLRFVRRFDQSLPAIHLCPVVSCKRLRVHLRGRHDLLANVRDAFLNLRIAKSFDDGSVQSFDNRIGSAAGRPQAAPSGDMKRGGAPPPPPRGVWGGRQRATERDTTR